MRFYYYNVLRLIIRFIGSVNDQYFNTILWSIFNNNLKGIILAPVESSMTSQNVQPSQGILQIAS